MNIALAVSCVVTIAGLALAEALSVLLAGNDGSEATRAMIIVFAVALPVAATYELFLAITRGLARMRPTILIERILRPLLQLAAVAYAGLVGADAGYLALSWVAPYGVGLICAIGSLRGIVRDNPGILAHGGSVDKKAVSSEFWAFTVPRGAARLGQVGLQRADIAIVVILAGPAAGALYTAVTRFLVLGQLAGSALQQVSEPQLARLLAVKDLDGAKLVARRLTLWTVLLTWPIYLIIAVYAEFFLILLFGTPYGAGTLSLQILALAMLFSTAMGPLDVLLLMAGRSSLSLINTTTALAVDVAGCLLLVPVMGITGAAIAWASAIITKNVLCFIQVRRSPGITPSSKELLWVTAALVLSFGALPSVVHHLASVPPAGEVTVLAVTAVSYVVLLWLRRGAILAGSAGPPPRRPASNTA
ncbi:lipopolysaccharide biosynthesis protein [Arthrobacter sp. H20]|uniref:polysaccharide biosynthesis C-terminal domain-containing protein n=1 Tax=Arthrobacter sp. H20 TaxID=1267981 RepID=UPI00138AF712